MHDELTAMDIRKMRQELDERKLRLMPSSLRRSSVLGLWGSEREL